MLPNPRNYQIQRTRSPQLGRFNAGTFDGIFNNKDRNLEPLYSGGANYPNVRIRKRLRTRVTANGVTYPRFDGFLEGVYPSYPASGTDAIVDIKAADAFRLFAGRPLAAPYPLTVLSDAPLRWYRLQEGAGAVAADSSGNGTSATYSASGITYAQAGPLAEAGAMAVTLDGVTGKLVVPPYASFSAAWSIEVWILKTGTPPGTIIGQGRPGFFTLLLQLDAGGHLTDTITTSSAALNDGVWHHIVSTWNGAGTGALYLDGALVGSNTGIFGTNLGTDQMWVGGSPASGQLWSGTVAEPTFYAAALSAARVAAHYAARTAWVGDTSDARISKILDDTGWSATDRDLSAGIAVLTDAADLASKKELDHFRDIDTTEGGALFMSQSNKVTLRNRRALQGGVTGVAASSTSQLTFGDGGGSEIPFTGIVFSFDDVEFANMTTVARRNGITAVFTDAASITKYGGVQELSSRTSLSNSDADANTEAQWLLKLLKDPNLLRIEQLTVSVNSDTLGNAAVAAVLALEMWFRVTVKFQPPGGGTRIVQDAIVTGISDNATPSRYDVTFLLSGRELQLTPFLVGTSLVGGTDVVVW